MTGQEKNTDPLPFLVFREGSFQEEFVADCESSTLCPTHTIRRASRSSVNKDYVFVSVAISHEKKLDEIKNKRIFEEMSMKCHKENKKDTDHSMFFDTVALSSDEGRHTSRHPTRRRTRATGRRVDSRKPLTKS
ncbi:hypothetical protein NPIL_341611 [Nephila pilipes]|uniref:Uncharacterized protein n=1 Tax=Nephila pilipes TaxID=299642 RepID=A0A8X6NUC5_NEPPI|nr:hypothetical protein NPIL_341611 [Nephila pilipes]